MLMLQNSKVKSRHLSSWNCWVCYRFNPSLASRWAIMATCCFCFFCEPMSRAFEINGISGTMSRCGVHKFLCMRKFAASYKKESAQVHSEPNCLLSKKHFTTRNLLKIKHGATKRGWHDSNLTVTHCWEKRLIGEQIYFTIIWAAARYSKLTCNRTTGGGMSLDVDHIWCNLVNSDKKHFM